MSDTRERIISWWLLFFAWLLSQPAKIADLTTLEKVGTVFALAAMVALVIPSLVRVAKERKP